MSTLRVSPFPFPAADDAAAALEHAVTETSVFTGEFRDSAELRAEFLAAVRRDVAGRPERRVPERLE